MTERVGVNRAALLGAGILGFAGVTAAAASSHVGSDPRMLDAVATICLAHAPALLALALLAPRHVVLRVAALLLFAGAALFSADVGLRALGYGRLFFMAAPAGGGVMLAGWLAVALSAVTMRRPAAHP